MPTANYIIGTPGETVAEMRETIALHHELQPVDFGYFVFYPYPGTDLFQTCRENGWLPDDYLTRAANHRQSILNLPNVTQEQITTIYDAWTAIRTETAVSRSHPSDAEQIRLDIREAALRG
jgi:tRNA A37 methylthiotransferase MiaB